MAEPVPNTVSAASTFNPASNPQTGSGKAFPNVPHEHSLDDGKSDSLPNSTNVSTQQALTTLPNDVVTNEKSTDDRPPEPVRKITGIKWVLVLLSILSSTFLFALDNTVVADVQPQIVQAFGEIQKLSWLPVAFLVAAVSTNLIWYV